MTALHSFIIFAFIYWENRVKILITYSLSNSYEVVVKILAPNT